MSDYWILNLVDRVLEIYREPIRDDAARYGWRYGSVRTLRPEDTATPLNVPDVQLSVAALLPSRPRPPAAGL